MITANLAESAGYIYPENQILENNPQNLQTVSYANPTTPIKQNYINPPDIIKDAEISTFSQEIPFQNLIDTLTDGILIVSPDGKIVKSNPAALNILKLDILRLKEITDLFQFSNSIHNPQCRLLRADGTDLSLYDFNIRQAILEKKTLENEEIGFQYVDGPITWLKTRTIPVMDKRREIGILLITFQDITKTKKIEEVQLETNEYNYNLLESSPNAIIVYNPDTSIRSINSAIEKLTGFSSLELIGQKAPYPWWPKKDHKLLTQIFFDNKIQGTIKIEHCYQRKDGKNIWIETINVPCRTNHKINYYISNMVDITDRKRLQDETEFYLMEVTKIQEEERKRIARELHDDTAQSLAYLNLELDSLLHNREITSNKIFNRLSELKQKVNDSLNEVRRFSHELRPGVLDQLGLIAAQEVVIDEINARSQVKITFNVSGQERRLSGEEELALFRITQEALSNIRKHAQATRAEVSIKFTRNTVKLSITDNGKGFPASEIDQAVAKGRLGLIGMRERARLIGSNISIKSKPNKGTAINIVLSKTD